MKTKTKKKGRGLKITAIVLAAIIFVIGVCVLITYISSEANIKYAKNVETVKIENQLKPEIDPETGFWTFKCDRDFRVMQLTDVHIGGGFLSIQKDNWALNAVANLITDQKPDLVIVTGDIGFPVPFIAGTFNNLTPVKEFSSLMEKLGVYWTFVYGNHDTEVYSYYTRDDIDRYYNEKIAGGEFKYCLYKSSFSGTIDGYEGIEADAGYGNTVINVKDSEGVITQSLFIFDSHSYEKGFFQDYDHMHKCQIDWYEKTVKELNALNKTKLGLTGDVMTLKSLAFFHIPMSEYKDAYKEWYDNGQKDTESVQLKYGVMGEDLDGEWVYCGVTEDELFETMMRLNSTQGVFCGHDHYNNFSLFYKKPTDDHSIRLTYGMSIDYLAYFGIAKKTAQRGCTMITIKTDGSFDCFGYRLVDKTIID